MLEKKILKFDISPQVCIPEIKERLPEIQSSWKIHGYNNKLKLRWLTTIHFGHLSNGKRLNLKI